MVDLLAGIAGGPLYCGTWLFELGRQSCYSG